jgi:hydroxymethylpyrimidine pyrophosphatase-like HAD family hydrolase
MPAFGKFEYCRISCDVTLDWDDKAYMHMIHRERPSTKNAVANILSRRALNGRAYLSDPDVFFLRTENCQLSQKQKYSLAVLDALCGGVFLTSDDPGSYTKEMKEQYRLYRSLTKATNVQIMNDRGITAVYDLDDETKALCDISYSSNRYIEFNKAGVNKGKGIRFLSEYLNIPIEQTMAIGDNYNDLPMLIEAGLGIGVKNTNPRMVDEVDLIVPWTNDEDAVGHIIDEYFLNEK